MAERTQRLRRDLNNFLFYRDGKPEASKFWSNVGCGIVAYWMVVTPERVWTDWVASIAIASALIAPDLFRKIMNERVGTSSTVTTERTTTTEAAKP